MFLTVQFGDYRCSSTLASTVCSLSNSHSIAVVLIVLVLGDDHIFTTRLLETMRPSVLSRMPMVTSPCLRWVTTRIITNPFPKVNVTVNFGDGTGEQLWNREDPRHLWMHQYQMPGFYWVSVSSNLTIHATGHLPFNSNHFFLMVSASCTPIFSPTIARSSQRLWLDRGQREAGGGGRRPHRGQHGDGGAVFQQGIGLVGVTPKAKDVCMFGSGKKVIDRRTTTYYWLTRDASPRCGRAKWLIRDLGPYTFERRQQVFNLLQKSNQVAKKAKIRWPLSTFMHCTNVCCCKNIFKINILSQPIFRPKFKTKMLDIQLFFVQHFARLCV